MLVSFDSAVSALTDSIIEEQCLGAGPEATGSREAVTRFLIQLHASMPDYLRFPMKCLTLAFDAWPLPFTGKPFHRLSHEQRCRQIRAWRHSAIGKRRDLMKFYDSLVVFGCYSTVYAPVQSPGRSESNPSFSSNRPHNRV